MLIGLYYYSTFVSGIVDLGLFEPEDCSSVKLCVKSENGFIMFVLDDSEYIGITLVPKDLSQSYASTIDYRLINMEEQQFMIQTLILMGLGFLLILLLLIVLFKALNLAA